MATTYLNDLLSTLSDRGRALIGRPREGAGGRSLIELGDHLISGRGEASGVAIARALLDGYASAPLATRLAFLTALNDRFGPDRGRIERAIEHYGRDQGALAIQELHAAAEA